MVDSPCNDVCTTNPESGLCVGCGRTTNEIANWFSYSDSQKKKLLKDLKTRNNFDSGLQHNVLDKSIMNILFDGIKKNTFPIGLILILTFSRLIPHPPNFTPVIAVAIMSGVFFKNIYLSLGILLISMLLADAFIGFYSNIIFVYLSLFLVTFIFYKISKKINFKNLLFYSFGSSIIFFVISNFGVWALGNPAVNNIPYEKNIEGLIQCYVLAIPFFANTFLSTVIFAYPAIYIYKSLPTWASSR
jgi:predicted Fe-S protein YdhL (DUF1289 family)